MNSNESEKLAEILVDMANALEAMAVNVKRQIAELKGVSEEKAHEWTWNPQKIPWVKAEGSRGAYERYPAQDKRPEATLDYKNLLQALKEHKNFLFRDGYNYWLFQDAITVGRKVKPKT